MLFTAGEPSHFTEDGPLAPLVLAILSSTPYQIESIALDVTMSDLELDCRFDLPITCPKREEEDKHLHCLPDGLQVSYPQKPSSLQARRVCGLRFTAFTLSVALASVALLAIVAAALGGKLDAKTVRKYRALTESSKR